jgi:predicted RNase H-like HicB family nuclease/uncharacterized damage-inducible protein DinB
MHYPIAVEDMELNHWIVWVPTLPACYSSAQTQAAAIAGVDQAIHDYFAWRAVHGIPHPHAAESIETEIVEIFQSHFAINYPDYFVNAFFADDTRPLTDHDIQETAALLDCTHRDLLAVVQNLSNEQLNLRYPQDERFGTIANILNHVAGSEWWYFNNIDRAFDRQQIKGGSLRRLETVRAHTLKTLPELVGDIQITQRLEETWSARKVLRRTLWHERDHTQHIAKLLKGEL